MDPGADLLDRLADGASIERHLGQAYLRIVDVRRHQRLDALLRDVEDGQRQAHAREHPAQVGSPSVSVVATGSLLSGFGVPRRTTSSSRA